MTTPDTDDASGRIGTLSGAGVQVDGRKAAQVVVALCLVTLAVLVVVFTVSGIRKNDQINRLHQHGVDVTFTVTGCLGLLGGSGSNAAGYECHGTFRLDGVTYSETLPGTAFRRPGSTVPAVAVPGDPGLVSPASTVASSRTSSSVFILPGALLAALVLLVGVVLVRRRQTPPAPAT